MSGALLSEVWPDMVNKPRKVKKLKKKKSGDPLMDPPMTPYEMETELLTELPSKFVVPPYETTF